MFCLIKESLIEIMEDNEIGVKLFAQKVGLDQAAIRRWLYGSYLPDTESVIKIVDEFKISADYLFGLSDEKKINLKIATNSFYDRYVKLKNERAYTDYFVAKSIGIRDSAISKWKRIRKFPNIDTLIKLSDFLQCSLNYLLGREED